MKKNYIAYYRVSTDKQGIDGYGMDAQKVDVAKYVESNSGQLIDEFIEVESGAKSDRIEVWNAIDKCKDTNSILVIAKLDRLGRNVSFISHLMDSGIEFVACDMPHASRFELHIRAAVAEEERRMISERVKKGLSQAKAKGVKLGGYRPALDRHNHKKRTDAAKFAEMMKPKIEMMLSKGLSQREMAKTLNAFGVKTSTGKEWSNVQVGRLIKLNKENP